MSVAPNSTLLDSVTPAAGGVDEETFIYRLRSRLRDFPKVADQQINGVGGTTTRYLCSPPINDDSNLQISVGGALTPWTTTRPPQAGQVYVDCDSGLLIFGAAPPAGVNNIQVQKMQVRWRNGVLLDALNAGLRATFPLRWQRCIDTSIQLKTLVYDYDLPDVFSDPIIQISSVAVREIPATTERFVPIPGAYRVGSRTLHVPWSQSFSPGSTLRIEYIGPYRSLSELNPQDFELPILYACGQLLAFNEVQRGRMDQQKTATGEDATPPDQQIKSASWFYQRFQDELNRRSTPFPVADFISTYDL